MNVPAASLLGQRMRQRDPLIGSNLGRLACKQGVWLVGRALSASGSSVRFANGVESPFASMIWATGFRPNYQWLKVPVLDPQGRPVQRRGVIRGRAATLSGCPGCISVTQPSWVAFAAAVFLAAQIAAQLAPSSVRIAVSAS